MVCFYLKLTPACAFVCLLLQGICVLVFIFLAKKKKKSPNHAHYTSTIFRVPVSLKWIRSLEIFLKQFDFRLLKSPPPTSYFMVVFSILNFNKEFLITTTFILFFFQKIQFSFHRNSNFFKYSDCTRL